MFLAYSAGLGGGYTATEPMPESVVDPLLPHPGRIAGSRRVSGDRPGDIGWWGSELRLRSQCPGVRWSASASTGLGTSHGFLASNGLLSDLKTLPGGQNSEARGINDWGQVAGRSEVQINGSLTTHAFVATLDSSGPLTMRDLGTLPGGTWSEATSINNAGLVAGAGGTASGRSHAFVGAGGGLVDLGTLPGGLDSQANAINDLGVVTGWSSTSNGEIHAFRGGAGGGLVDLGVLPGATFSTGLGINLFGQVAGYSSGLGFNPHAFVTAPDGRLIDLGIPTGALASYASGLNDAGVVVGHFDLLGGRSHAFLWNAGTGMVDLNSLIDPTSAWELTVASAINANGQVTGFGLVNVMTPNGLRRETHAFRLDPVTSIPAPSSAVLMALGTLGLAGWGRLRRGGTASRRVFGRADASPGR